MAQNNSSYRTNNDSSSNTTPRLQFQPPHLVQQLQLYNLHTRESLYLARDHLPPSESAYLNQGSPSRSPTLSSPPTSASATGIPANWPSHSQQQESYHLTSNWAEDSEGYSTRNRLLQQQAYQQSGFLPTQSRRQVRVKRASMSYKNEDKSTAGAAGASTVASTSGRTSASRDDPMPSTSDFVKKLYKMLEDPSFQSVVCWGPLGDCFVVKDMNEFTKSILPRMFKHSNFASFVRQLNKYDFHKVKNMDDNQFGEHSWTFRHPDFHADRRDALENIKRKVPAQRKTALAAAALAAAAQQTAGGTTSSGSLPSNNSTSNANSSSSLPYAPKSQSGSGSQSYQQSSSNPSGESYPAGSGGVGGRSDSPTRAHLTAEIQRLKDEGEDLRGRIRVLERNYENVLVEMVGFQRGMAQQDGLMQSLIAYFLGSEDGKNKASTSSSSSASAPNPDLTPASSLPTRIRGSPPRPTIPIPTERTSPATQSSATSTTTAPTAKALAYQQLKQQIYAHLAAREASAAQPFSGGLGIGLGLGGLASAAYAQTAPTQTQAQIQRTGLRTPATLSASLSDQNPFVQTPVVQRMLDTTSLSSLSAAGASASAGLSGPGSGFYHSQTEISPPSAPGPQDLGRATLMQMSELSRRAAVAAAAGVPLPTSFSALYGGGDGQRHQQPQQPQQQQGDHQKLSRADALGQIKEIHRERSSQDGWAGAAGASGSTQAQPLRPPQQQEHSSNWDARGRSLGRSGGFGEEREKHQERQRQRALSMQMDVDMEMDTRGRSEAQQSRRRRQSDGVRFLSEDRMRVGVAGGGDDRDKSPEEYVMPTRQNVVDQPPQQASSSSSAQQQQQPTGATPFGPPPPGSSGNNPWATMFNFGSTSSLPNITDAFNNLPMNPTDEHEGLQVYTVGHLLPRNTGGDDTQGSWTFDASRLATGGMLGGLGIGGVGGTGAGPPNSSEENYSQGSEEMVQPTLSNALITAESSPDSSSGSSSAASGDASGQKLRVRRSTFVPGWAVPPRVLLVDDDAVSRQLSSKFLKVFGCTTDVAVDGVAAVNKMNLEKYDLVLMDIVMPKLDGVSATNLIRKFDQGTPIISMTSNSKPNEIMTYYSSGMNDILPKPFTKEGLLDMLEKHLMHLKVIQRQMNMSKLGLNALGSIPKNVGALPPLSDTNFEHAITNSARALMAESGVDPNSTGEDSSSSSNSGTIVASSSTPRPLSPFDFNFGPPYFPSAQRPSEEDEGRINPLAGMGLTDEQYNLILQNIVSGDGFLDGMDNLMSSSPSATPSGSGLGSSSGYAGGDGIGFLGSEASTPTPAMGMYAGGGISMSGEKRERGLEEEGEGQRDGKMKRGRYDVG